MKLGVFGPAFVRGKQYDTDEAFEYICACLDELDDVANVVTGGGKGVEQMALKWATLRHLESEVVPPNIKVHGAENAFIYRNREILKIIDFGILFWDGKDQKSHRLLSDAVEEQTRILVIHVE